MNAMLLRTVALRTVRDARRSLIGYALALVLLIAMVGAVWPSMEAQGDEFQKLIESYPPAMQAFFGDLGQMNTPEGYLQAEMFSAMLPLLVLLFAIGRSADTIAGEEERGALDTLLAHPVSRRRAFLEKAAGVAIGLVLIAAVVALSTLAVSLAFGMGLSATGILAASLMTLLLGLAHEGVTLALAGWRGRKGTVIALASAVAVGSYLLTGLARLVPELERVRYASLFTYFAETNALRDGLDVSGALVLMLVAGAGVVVGMLLFERRDVGT